MSTPSKVSNETNVDSVDSVDSADFLKTHAERLEELAIVSKWVSSIFGWILSLVLIVSIGIFISGHLDIIGKISDPAFARGLITFIITLSTIGLAFFMAIKAFSTTSTPEEKAEADNKYRRAREIFASLMGILGTIVGFYFGSAEKVTPLLNVADIQIVDKTVVSNVTGGTEPYRYTITPSSDAKDVKDGKLDPVLDKVSPDGWIKEQYPEKPKSGTLTIVVTDSKNASASKTKEIKSTNEAPKNETNVDQSKMK